MRLNFNTSSDEDACLPIASSAKNAFNLKIQSYFYMHKFPQGFWGFGAGCDQERGQAQGC